MVLNKQDIELLKEFANEYDCKLRTNYSGRGMYGKSCIGFVTDLSPFSLGLELALFLNREDRTEMVDTFSQTRVNEDSMGLSNIIYFPSIQAEEQDEDDEDEYDEDDE
jgi:hypothetical protein